VIRGGFESGDHLDFSAYGITDEAGALAIAHDNAAGNVVFDLPGGDLVVIAGVSIADLPADFIV
jgi:hypothetical protein